jgi:hypothetical protein
MFDVHVSSWSAVAAHSGFVETHIAHRDSAAEAEERGASGGGWVWVPFLRLRAGFGSTWRIASGRSFAAAQGVAGCRALRF